MLSYLTDIFATFGLRAKYQRLVHERLLELTQESGPEPVADDPGRWTMAGDARSLPQQERTDARSKARELVQHNPHGRNVLRLLEAYVTGPGLKLTHKVRACARAKSVGLRAKNESSTASPSLSPQPSTLSLGAAETADSLWAEFLSVNDRHYSFREHARRAWRDGECFVRKFRGSQWPPAVRFVDPETIGATPDQPDSQGIVTEPHDVETPIHYLRLDQVTGRLLEAVPATEMLHTRLGVDSNQKRGITIFLPILETLDCFSKWVETELLARKLQSSIVLWRKVQGSPQQASALADSQSAFASPSGGRSERLKPGTIITTNHATDIQFLQPNTNFGDAVPLGRMLLLAVAAGAGLPEFMLTSDASNANYASTMVAEGPAVKLFQGEQQFFSGEFTSLWRWVMSEAISHGLLPTNFFEQIESNWTFPQLVNRDRPRERLTDVRLVETGILSRAEVARRDGVDPVAMKSELAVEAPSPDSKDATATPATES